MAALQSPETAETPEQEEEKITVKRVKLTLQRIPEMWNSQNISRDIYRISPQDVPFHSLNLNNAEFAGHPPDIPPRFFISGEFSSGTKDTTVFSLLGEDFWYPRLREKTRLFSVKLCYMSSHPVCSAVNIP